MSFTDILREARSAPTAVLHEFLTQYTATPGRVHAFFEGHDDQAFFVPALKRYAPSDTRILPYCCNGKAQVCELFSQITTRIPGVKGALFFIDKDLDDILGRPWPTDPRIFVTDVYSVENYLVSRHTLESLLNTSIKLRGMNHALADAAILDQFDIQLQRFQRLMLPVMAWILVMRRAQVNLNLANIGMHNLCILTNEGKARAARGRLRALLKGTGASDNGKGFKDVRNAAKELRRLPTKRILRGKFEAWFFVEFWRRIVARLTTIAEECDGKVNIRVRLEHGNFVPTLALHSPIPPSLALFFQAHFPEATISQEPPPKRTTFYAWLRRLVRRSAGAN